MHYSANQSLILSASWCTFLGCRHWLSVILQSVLKLVHTVMHTVLLHFSQLALLVCSQNCSLFFWPFNKPMSPVCVSVNLYTVQSGVRLLERSVARQLNCHFAITCCLDIYSCVACRLLEKCFSNATVSDCGVISVCISVLCPAPTNSNHKHTHTHTWTSNWQFFRSCDCTRAKLYPFDRCARHQLICPVRV